MAQTATVTYMLVDTSITAGFTPLVMGLGDIWVKHTITERSASARITVVALHPVVFGLSIYIFPWEARRQRRSSKQWRKTKAW
jgi:hypothetical protein